MKKRQPNPFSPNRRCTNRIILVSLVIAGIYIAGVRWLMSTYLFYEDYTTVGWIITLSCGGFALWLYVTAWMRSWLAVPVMLAIIFCTILVFIDFVLHTPLVVHDRVNTGSDTYYLLETPGSRNPDYSNVFFPHELYRCAGDSVRMADCEWLWYEQTLHLSLPACGLEKTYLEDTYLTVRADILRVEVEMQCAGDTTDSKNAIHHRVLHEINLTEGQE